MASRSMPGILQRGGKKSCLGLRVQSPPSSVLCVHRDQAQLPAGGRAEAGGCSREPLTLSARACRVCTRPLLGGRL